VATITEIILEDDIDGSPAERTVRFAIDGEQYETELSAENLERLTASLARYIDAARVLVPNGKARGKRRTPGRAVTPPPSGRAAATVLARPDMSASNDAIRKWAQVNRPDLGVKDRGRVSVAAVAAYNAARGLK
jgi:nucleoid-associated protein Lsr2